MARVLLDKVNKLFGDVVAVRVSGGLPSEGELRAVEARAVRREDGRRRCGGRTGTRVTAGRF